MLVYQRVIRIISDTKKALDDGNRNISTEIGHLEIFRDDGKKTELFGYSYL